MRVHSTALFPVCVLLVGGSVAASPWICLEAEEFEKTDAQCRNFGGVVGVVFPKTESSIHTSVELPGNVTAEVWARVYFPWSGQEAVSLRLDDREFRIVARTASAGGRWDVGNFQVWHWVRVAGLPLAAGKHELSLAPAASSGQRVDRVVLHWGEEPAWLCSWFGGGAVLPNPVAEWDPAASLVVPAVDCAEFEADIETLGKHKVAVLRNDADRLVAVFKTRSAVRASVWARVWFEAKNMYEGLTMQEMASNLYVAVDGEVRKTVYEQNARQWHWVALDEPQQLGAGVHRIALYKCGLPVKVACVVVHAGEDALDQPWFRSPAPPNLPFSIAADPEVGRAGHWRVHCPVPVGEMGLLGEREGPAKWPVRVELPGAATVVDLERVVGMAENPVHGDRTPHQQVSLWVKNSGVPPAVSLLYTDRNGEAFLQRLHDESPWTGWRLLSANIPSRIEPGEAGFDGTGYATEAAVTPPADAAASSASAVGVSFAGGDRNATPDFPLDVRAVRFVKPAGAGEVVVGEPFCESPFALRLRLARQTEAEAAFHAEVRNGSPAEKVARLEYRFGDRLADLTEKAVQAALFQRRDVAVRARSAAAVPITLKASHPGIYYVECHVGRGPAVRRYVAFGGDWEDRLAELRRGWEREAGAMRFSGDGQDRPLKRADGRPLRPEEVAAEYGAEKGLAVLDDGSDVCSLEYAARRDFAHPIKPRGYDLSDEAGWPHVHVPNGVLAIDPALGRAKFAEADRRRLSLRSALATGFGVPGPPIVVRGQFAYPGPGEGHYSVVDCTDKRHPRVVSQIASWYFSHRLLPLGDQAYFESSRRGLILVDDLSNPYCPGPLRNVRFDRGTCGRMTHVFEKEKIGYSTGGREPALRIFDLSSPLYPREIGKTDGLSSFFPVGRRGFSYLEDTVRVLDVTDLRKPKLLPGEIRRETSDDGKNKAGVFAVSEDMVALLTGRRIDVYRYTAENTLAAEKAATFDVPEGSGRHVFGTFQDGLLYVIDGKHGPGQYSLSADSPASRWFVFRVGKEEVEQVGFYEHPWPSAFGNITVVDQTAYVSDYNYGMWLFDLTDPLTPKRLGGAITAGESDAIWIDGDRACQWQTFGGAVFLLDISDPDAPSQLGAYWDGAWVPYDNTRRGNQTVAGKDGFLYIPRQRRGLLVVDVRNPSAAKVVADFKDESNEPLTNVRGACIDVWGDRAYVLLKEKLLVYDVAEAARPRLASHLAIPPSDVLCAKGKLLYLGHRDGGFAVVDVANAAQPSVLATLDLKPHGPAEMSQVISGLTVAKGHAYLTGRGPRNQGSNFLHIVDVRNPRQPRWVDTYDPRPELPDAPCSMWSDFYQDVIADGDFLFIGDYGEIQCLDISEPTKPQLFDVLHVGFQWSVGRKRGEHLFVPALSGLLVLRSPNSSQAPVGKLRLEARF